MSRAKQPAKQGATRGKLILIGVLGVVLVVVVVVQLPSSSQPAAAARPSKPDDSGPDEGEPSASDAASSNQSASSANKEWPVIPLETVLQSNPFAIGAWGVSNEHLERTEVAATDDAEGETEDIGLQTLHLLRQQGVSMVMMIDGQKVARIGSQHVRVGDRLGEYEVAEINTDGVVLIEPQAN